MMIVRRVQDLTQQNPGQSCRVKIQGQDQEELVGLTRDMVKLELLKEWQMEVVRNLQFNHYTIYNQYKIERNLTK